MTSRTGRLGRVSVSTTAALFPLELLTFIHRLDVVIVDSSLFACMFFNNTTTLTTQSVGSAVPNQSAVKSGDLMSREPSSLFLSASTSSIVQSQYGRVSFGFTSCRLNSKVLETSEWVVKNPSPSWNCRYRRSSRYTDGGARGRGCGKSTTGHARNRSSQNAPLCMRTNLSARGGTICLRCIPTACAAKS